MKKVALVFVLAVILPSLVLAWLAVRSLRDQQFVLEHQQALIDQHVTDALAQNISDYLAQQQQAFSAQVETLAAGKDPRDVAAQFDNAIRRRWPLADVGFCVTLSGKILSPASDARPEAQKFFDDNKDFLGNRQTAEVYWNQNLGVAANANNSWGSSTREAARIQSPDQSYASSFGGQKQVSSGRSQQTLAYAPAPAVPPAVQEKEELDGAAASQPDKTAEFGSAKLQLNKKPTEIPPAATVSGMIAGGSTITNAMKPGAPPVAASDAVALNEPQTQTANAFNYKSAQVRKVSPQQNVSYQLIDQLKNSSNEQNFSKAIPADAEFRQLIGDQTDGMLARFLQNKLKLMFWHRLNRDPNLVFGAELNLNRVVDDLRKLVQPDPTQQNEVCLALLDDNARPVALSRAGFHANWKRPFVATEIGDALPHWEAAAYLVNPAALTRTACLINIILGLLIVMLVLAIVVGSWLIVRNLNYELTLARQKTDFVSNVSHELKTPLTSIRMFSELLAEQRVPDQAKQRSYLQIITAEAARLTRLINNVLDFSRMERGEKKYNFQPCDLTDIARSAAETFRPHLEAGGFRFNCELPETKIPGRGDADALSQIIVNLLSNAEKYSNGGKEISLQLAQKQSPLPYAEIKVLDRGSGVPQGSGEKIFEKFYRAHDSLSSGVQGSGLGLTIARQIARAHGGDVIYEPRAGGGSCFILRLPLKSETANERI